jgi:ubiquinone/menaquinone biosynthesis C-methylase UbiE
MATLTNLDRLRYIAGQSARVAWLTAEYLIAHRLSTSAMTDRRAVAPKPPTSTTASSPARSPTRAGLYQDIAALMARDLSNIARGDYRAHIVDFAPTPALLADTARFFADLPKVNRRRRRKTGGQEVNTTAPDTLPRYYRQNFHFQTDGYLSADSARMYDHQVEVLFGGAGDAMRRQTIVPIAEYLRTVKPPHQTYVLDVGCGTGQLLCRLADAYPRLTLQGADLSQPYLAEARRRLDRRRARAALAQAAGEALPLRDASVDIITSVFLLHELPRAVRLAVLAEMRRVLRPGGLLVLTDSLAVGDHSPYDPLLRAFPIAFHEPYYHDYLTHDLTGALIIAGFDPAPPTRAFLSKVITAWG